MSYTQILFLIAHKFFPKIRRISLLSSLSPSPPTSAREQVCVFAHMCTCGSQRELNLRYIAQLPSTLFFETMSLIVLELAHLAGLVARKLYGSQQWDYKTTSPCLAFYMSSGDQAQVLMYPPSLRDTPSNYKKMTQA